jgi:hypothetical protein
MPGRVYFTPAAARAGEQGTWLISGHGCRLRLETLAPLRSLRIRVQNRSGREQLSLTAALFDVVAASWQLPPGAADQVRLERPRFRKINGRFGYQLDLQAKHGSPAAAQAWLLALELR